VNTLQEVCCARLGISPAAFEEKVLLACLPTAYRPLGWLRWRLNRSYFDPDLEFIRAVAGCTCLRDINSEITFFHHKRITGVQRRILRFRISGKRLLSFANRFLPYNGGPRWEKETKAARTGLA
jgi:hypothetical protein